MQKGHKDIRAASGSIICSSTHPGDLNYIRKNIPCQWACPAMTDIPGYIEAIYNGDYDRAYAINHSANLFPGDLVRICSCLCEQVCRHGDIDLGDSVSICQHNGSSEKAADLNYNEYENMYHKDSIHTVEC